MLKRTLNLTLSVGLMLAASGQLAAQAWDAPSFLTPRPVQEVGLSFIVPENSDWGLVGYFRQPNVIANALKLGIRGGYLDRDPGSAGLVGIDASGMLMSTAEGNRVDLAWTVGLGGTFGRDVTEVRVPLGVTGGILLPVARALTIYPYVHPRIGVDIDLEGNKTDGRTVVNLDVGADIGLGQHILLRLAGTLLESAAWGIGLAWIGGPTLPVSAN